NRPCRRSLPADAPTANNISTGADGSVALQLQSRISTSLTDVTCSPWPRADDDRSRPYGAGSGRSCARLSEPLRRTGQLAICLPHAPSRTNPCQHPWSDVGVPLGEGFIRLQIPSRPTDATEELSEDHAVGPSSRSGTRLAVTWGRWCSNEAPHRTDRS